MASRPSTSSLKIARGLIHLAQDPRLGPLLPQGCGAATSELLHAAGLLSERMEHFLESPTYTRLQHAAEGLASPGGTLHAVLRKRFVDDTVRGAVKAGARQVLVLGAGLDTLGLRLSADFPELRVVEIDQAGTIAAKLDGVRQLQPERPMLELVGADLSQTPLEGLLRPGLWQPELRSVVVAEGLLMYLREEEVRHTLELLYARCGPDSTLVFTALLATADGRNPMSWLMRMSLGMVGEHIRWCPSQAELRALLEGCGWGLQELPEAAALVERYLLGTGLEREPLAMDEVFGLAVRR